MKPSDVMLFRSILPLIDTFGSAEQEFAAALIVRTCVTDGDRWQPVAPRRVGEVMVADCQPGQAWASLQHNPFLPHPDFFALCQAGFARRLDDNSIEFTEKGLDVLRTKACLNKQPS